MVANIAKKYIHLIKDLDAEEVMLAAYGHDLIEDTRVSYSDVKTQLGETTADIIYAVSNEKGKTRKERANDKYYEGIRNTPGAVFVKFCDRIANVEYSKMTNSRMFEMYKKENKTFSYSLLGGGGADNKRLLRPMFSYLYELFQD
jgi:(p)ppGpp synthase/HD superfamily hydrolase